MMVADEVVDSPGAGTMIGGSLDIAAMGRQLDVEACIELHFWRHEACVIWSSWCVEGVEEIPTSAKFNLFCQVDLHHHHEKQAFFLILLYDSPMFTLLLDKG